MMMMMMMINVNWK